MRIGELADRSGVSVRSIRYYESQGLLRSRRTPAGQRNFDEAAVDRIVRIQELFAAGIGSRRIVDLLPCLEVPVAERTGELRQWLDAERGRLQMRRRDIDRELGVLEEIIREA